MRHEALAGGPRKLYRVAKIRVLDQLLLPIPPDYYDSRHSSGTSGSRARSCTELDSNLAEIVAAGSELGKTNSHDLVPVMLKQIKQAQT